MLFYPFTIVLSAALLEFLKIRFEINPYITSGLVVIIIMISLSILYKLEIRQILNKYLR